MKLQYIEVFRGKKRVYQGVCLGEEEPGQQIATIARGAILNNQELIRQSHVSWDIRNVDTRELWGRVELREF